MSGKKSVFMLLLVILLVCIFVLPAYSQEYQSKYARISQEEWEKLKSLNQRFDSPEKFLSEVDYYVEEISKYLGKSSVLEAFANNKIEFAVWERDSSARYGTIKLNATALKYDLAPIASQVTHMIASMTNIRWFKEGLAQYMQEKFGENPPLMTAGAPIMRLAKEFIQEKKEMLEIVGTTDATTSKSFNVFNDNIKEDGIRYTRIAAFCLGYSFTKYLIENYGIDKFMEIYNSKVYFGLDDEYKKIFGKGLEELRTEWLDYLETLEPFEYTYREWHNKVYSGE